MRSRWTIFWIVVLIAGISLLVWELGFRKAGSPETDAGQPQASSQSPEGERVAVSEEEIARWADAFKNGSEPWRADVVEVVKHERERLGIPPTAEIREHGQYTIRPGAARRTLVFALASGLDVSAQKTVLLEEHASGIWVPIEVGPFFFMVDQIEK
jgi:hypothetical protein